MYCVSKLGSNSYFSFLFRISYLFIFFFSSFIYFFLVESTLPNGGTQRNKIKKSSSLPKLSVSNSYAWPYPNPTTTTASTEAVVANVNGATYLEAKGQKDFKSHPRQRRQQNSDAANMDFLISQVPATTNDARREQELGVLLLNGINNNDNNYLNVKQQLMNHQQQQQHQQHLHHQRAQQKMTKKKMKLAQTQLDKMTHLHGMY